MLIKIEMKIVKLEYSDLKLIYWVERIIDKNFPGNQILIDWSYLYFEVSVREKCQFADKE